MKSTILAACAAATSIIGLTTSAQGAVSSLDELNYWGTGANRTGLAIFWNDGKNPGGLAWGYNWDGPTTVEDMLIDLAASDPNLYFRIDGATSFGASIFGIGYANSGTFSLSGAQDAGGNPVIPTFTAGINDLDTDGATTQSPASSAGVAPGNLVDRYQEGWNDNGFWEMYNSGNSDSALQASVAYPTTWTGSFVGISGTNLVDDAWAVLSFAPAFASTDPTGRSGELAAVPEPGSALLALVGFGYCMTRRQRPTA